MKAVPVPASVFISGGTLTLGSLTPGLNVALAMGDFNGYIDEVRVWSRPHNPSIITQNWRVTIKADTADVSHSWPFNEGIGLTANEDRKGESFIVDNALNPPTWKKSDLDLSADTYLKAPVMTTELPISLSDLQAAMDTCNNLIDTFSLSTGASNIDDIIAAFKALCMQEVAESNDTSLNCAFGTVTANGCECFETHWGVACDNICPVGPLGACNTFGVCDSVAGGCNCFSHYHGTQSSAVLYWTNFQTSTTIVKVADYSCDTCAEGWLGSDCHFAQATGTSTTTSVAFAFGSYITILDGVSLTFVTPGVYNLFQTTTLEIEALFLPCYGDHLCRYLQEISFKDSKSTISIQNVIGGNLTIVFDGETMEYPIAKSSSSMSIDWSYKMLYPRVTFGGSSVLVFSSSLGLVSAFKIASSDSQSNTGLLGSTDGNWVNDLNCATGNQIIDESLMTATYVGGCVRERYTPSSIFLQHPMGQNSLSSAGYSLYLEAQTLTLSGYPIQTGLPKFTLSFWTKVLSSSIVKRATTSYSLFLTNTGSQSLEFISNNGQLEIDWDQLYQTNKSFVPDKWTYVVFTWADDGSWSVYLITEDEVEFYTGPNALAGSTIDLGSITVVGTSQVFIQIDYIRAWSDTKSLENAVSDMKLYSSEHSTGLLLVLMLDEGSGLAPSILTFAADGTVTTTAGTISGITIYSL